MPDSTRTYLARDGFDLQGILAGLHQRCRVSEGPWRTIEQRFFDSFDWRLHAAGAVLEQRVDAEGARLVWHALGNDEEPVAQVCGQTPGLLVDLPDGPVRRRLSVVLGVRRLLPVVAIQSREQTLFIVGEQDEPIARLTILIGEAFDPGQARGGSLKARLTLEAVSGQAGEREVLIDLLERDPSLQRVSVPQPLMLEALSAVGREPRDYSSKIDFRLEGRARADANVKTILLGLLETLEANISGASAHLDPEFLHDLRVATRRTRSALTQIRGVFAPEVVGHYKSRFAWLQQVTSPARDLDVYRLNLEDYVASLPSALRGDLALLERFLADRHAAAQRQLTEVLGSPEIKSLLADWRAFLEAPVPDSAPAAHAERPLKEVADANIWRLYRRVRREGRAIGTESPAPELHELRKSTKKLRYLMEFFRRLYPSDDIGPLIKLTKVLLDNLGLFQDLAVQAAFLRSAAGEMNSEQRASTDALLAMGSLIGDLLHRQQRARERFADTFAEFDTKSTRRTFRALFKPGR